MIKKLACIAALGIALAGCAPTTDTTPRAPSASTVTLAYTPIRMLASLCAAGVSKPCQDPNVSANVKKALPIADAAVAEYARQTAADPSRSNVEKWTSYAISAVNVLAEGMAVYGVKE